MNSSLRSTLCASILALALGCTDSQPPQDFDSGGTGIRFLADGEMDGFATAREFRNFEFPRDHGGHPEFRTEWWYFTGNLFSQSNRRYGFQLTFFRYALQPNSVPRESAWAAREIWMAHFAITDASTDSLIAAERLSRGALGLAGSAEDSLNVWVEDWSARQDTSSGAIQLLARAEFAAIDLSLSASQRIVLQGDRGLDAKGPEPGNASYYYSWPRLTVNGSIWTATEGEQDVSGQAWLDREWGTSALSPGVVGWDWFALQLADGRDLMLYQLRNADGTKSPFSSAQLVDAGGRTTRLGPQEFDLESTRDWTSPASGTKYPVEWRISIPNQALVLDVSPIVDNQEIPLSVRYWEGAVDVNGRSAGAPVEGVGYLELAGY